MEEPPPNTDAPEEAVPAPGQAASSLRRRGVVVLNPPRLRARDVVVLVVVMLAVGVSHMARLAYPDRLLPQDKEQCKKYPRLSS